MWRTVCSIIPKNNSRIALNSKIISINGSERTKLAGNFNSESENHSCNSVSLTEPFMHLTIRLESHALIFYFNSVIFPDYIIFITTFRAFYDLFRSLNYCT